MFTKKFIFLFIVITFLFCVKDSFALNLKDAFKSQVSKDNTAPLADSSSGAGYLVVSDVGPTEIIGTIIQGALSLLGIIFLCLMVYAGGLWMTARGNEQQAEKAKNLITEAMIGLVIVVAAYAISYFVIKSIGAGNLKNLEDKNNSQVQNP